MLATRGQLMGDMAGVAFVVVDEGGSMRVQRVNLNFGEHIGQMLEILQRLE